MWKRRFEAAGRAGGTRLLGALALLGSLAAVAAPAPLSGQEILSRSVTLGSGEARLQLELSNGETVDVRFADGEVRVDEGVVGSYEADGALDRSWRALVREALSLENGALTALLRSWTPPEGDAGGVGSRIDTFLEDRLDRAAQATAEASPADPGAAQGEMGELGRELDTLGEELEGLGSALALLSRLDELSGLAEAVDLESLAGDDLRIVIDEDLEVGAGAQLRSSVLVVDGSLDVRGTIRGDVVVVDGDVDMWPGSRIVGVLTLSDGDLDNDGGEITGGVRRLDASRGNRFGPDLREEIRDEIRRDLAAEMNRSRGRDWWAPLRNVGGGIAGVVGTLFNVLILGLLGAALLHFGGSRFEAVADVARESPGRAALVGLAGSALILPLFIFGILALTVTIIGIPALLLWIPLFPVAVGLAVLVGYLAAARNTGLWLARQDYPYLDWVRVTNPLTLIFGGLLVLMSPFLGAHLVGMVGFLGFLEWLLKLTGVSLTVFAMSVGLGAVLLSRGGRPPEGWGSELFTGSWSDMGRGWRRRSAWHTDEPTAPTDAERTPGEWSTGAAGPSTPGDGEAGGSPDEPEGGAESDVPWSDSDRREPPDA